MTRRHRAILSVVKQAMKLRDINQAELSERSGVSQPTVSRYLAGRRTITSTNLGRILGVLKIKLVIEPLKAKARRQ